jgi:hypothetical protein
MRRWGPVLAIVWVLLTAAITLLGVVRNRSGEPIADIVLTERELPLSGWLPEENTGLSLRFDWVGRGFRSRDELAWLDRAKLESLGFDCRYPVDAASAPEHYARMLPRDAVLVLEYDGEAARRWIAAKEEEMEKLLRQAAIETDAAARGRREAEAREVLERAKTSTTRLFAVDAGLDAAELRRRYPDRSRYVLARGTVKAVAEPRGGDKPATPARLTGYVQSLVEAIHVPRSQRSLLESDRKQQTAGNPVPERIRDSLGLQSGGKPRPPRYRVRVRWGRRLEPWIVSVEPL